MNEASNHPLTMSSPHPCAYHYLVTPPAYWCDVCQAFRPPMTTHPQLDSAAAVEWGRFFFPGLETAIRPDGTVRCRRKDHADADWTRPLVINDWDEIHSAAAVLVGRGFAEGMNRNLIGEWDRTRHTGPHTNDFMAWLLTAPAEAWARAILQTVREVSR